MARPRWVWLSRRVRPRRFPSFARQTGQPCASCHTAFPELTPFGRRFKLGGYTMGGGMSMEEAPPIAGMLLPTFTKTKVQQDSPPTNPNGYPIAHVNDNFVMQQASLFYGGQITAISARSFRAPTTRRLSTLFSTTPTSVTPTPSRSGRSTCCTVST